MKLVLYEHITGGALADQPLPDSLAAEGEAMLQAISHDLLAVNDLSLVILRDTRLVKMKTSPRIEVLSIASLQHFDQHWQKLLAEQTFFLVVAPESNGVLAQRCYEIQQAGKFSLGCTEAVIRLCSDKFLTANTLLEHNIPTVPTTLAANWLSHNETWAADVWVVKPRDGAGCVDTFKLSSAKAVSALLQTMLPAQLEQTIVQPFISGIACSMTLLCDQQTVKVLSINRQQISYQASRLHVDKVQLCQQAIEGLSLETAAHLAKQIHTAFDGLWGIVGVDMLVQAEAVTVVEINPRFTTAYCELSAKTSVNAVAMLLRNAHHFIDKES